MCQNNGAVRLIDAETDRIYAIKSMELREQAARRLEMLGMTKGARLRVMNRKRCGSMIVKVRGTRFALGRNFVKGITVGSCNA